MAMVVQFRVLVCWHWQILKLDIDTDVHIAIVSRFHVAILGIEFVQNEASLKCYVSYKQVQTL